MAVRTRKDSKIALIMKVPLFAPLAKAQLTQVASIADEIDLPEDGSHPPGRARRRVLRSARRRGGGPTQRQEAATIGPGEFFGEIALVSDRPRTATVTATKPVRVLVIARANFRSVLLRTPEIALKVLAAFAERLPPDAT
jgi:CRP-like cAMP-binding protein